MKKENEFAVQRAEMRIQCTDIVQADWIARWKLSRQIRRLRTLGVLAYTLLSVHTHVCLGL